MTKSFVSWSGGKDALLALHKYVSEMNGNVCKLVNFSDQSKGRSVSHGIDSSFLIDQAAALNIELWQRPVVQSQFEQEYRETLRQLKSEGITIGVFGDLYLEAHRSWITTICREEGITPVFPLWEIPTEQLLEEFLRIGYRTWIVSVKKEDKFLPLLGKELSVKLLQTHFAPGEIDYCGENGEYHTFVFDGPLFQSPLAVRPSDSIHETERNYQTNLIYTQE